MSKIYRNTDSLLSITIRRFSDVQNEEECTTRAFPPQKPSSNLAAIKRGTGGRSSFNGNVITVFGGTGFLGRYIINQIGKLGSQIIIPYRGDPYFARNLKLAGDLGQVLFMPYDIHDEEAIRKSMKYSNIVINLIGREWETKNYTFDQSNVETAQRLARIAKEMNVERFFHFSPLNAMKDPPSFYTKKGSKYLSSKFHGEYAVKEEFPEATIFRMSDVYGQEDRFLTYYASAYRRSMKMIPLYKQGKETIKMPVSCLDISKAVARAVVDHETSGKTFELVGPLAYTLHDFIDYCYQVLRWDRIRKIPITPLFKMKVKWMSTMPSYPILSMDKLEREFVSDEIFGHPGLVDLGVNPSFLEDRIAWELMTYRRLNSYAPEVGEFVDAEPPNNLGAPRPILY